MAEHFLSILSFERIAKKAGISRLSKDGAQELREVVEEIALDIAERATRIALHAGRKTVQREDIEFIVGKVQIEEKPKPAKGEAKPQQQKQPQLAAEKPTAQAEPQEEKPPSPSA